jgi:hypothetical protein
VLFNLPFAPFTLWAAELKKKRIQREPKLLLPRLPSSITRQLDLLWPRFLSWLTSPIYPGQRAWLCCRTFSKSARSPSSSCLTFFNFFGNFEQKLHSCECLYFCVPIACRERFGPLQFSAKPQPLTSVSGARNVRVRWCRWTSWTQATGRE